MGRNAKQGIEVTAAWRILLAELGIDESELLHELGLPADLFTQGRRTLRTSGLFLLWETLAQRVGAFELARRATEIAIGKSFTPVVFASLCSPDFRKAIERLTAHVSLAGPIDLVVDDGPETLGITVSWQYTDEPPPSLLGLELVFLVQLARYATRHQVVPRLVTSARPLEPAGAFEDYLGVPVHVSHETSVVFEQADTRRPFLTANEHMWGVFEPSLRAVGIDEPDTTTSQRVRALLAELLPIGLANADVVAKRLALSRRTLQRRLFEEDTSFLALQRETRIALAKHYLGNTHVHVAEISLLLGYEEKTSFYRAFNSWTGQTPDTWRSSNRRLS